MSEKCPIDYKIPDKPIGYDRDKIRYGELGYGTITKNIPVKEVEIGEVAPLDIYRRAKKFKKLYKAGVKLPPIHVFGKRYPNDTYRVFDGHARLEAHKQLKHRLIFAGIHLVNFDGSSYNKKERL